MALVAVLLTLVLLAALGGGLLQVATTESRIVLHHRQDIEALYAAEALVELIRAELASVSDVDALLAGTARATVIDGPPAGVRVVHGAVFDLSAATNVEQCGRPTACSDAAIRAVTAERPRGADNPRWRLYAHGWLRQVVADSEAPPIYLLAWVGDDPFETDGDALRDGSGRGRGRVAIRIRAHGRQGARREVDGVVAGVPRNPRVVRWEER